ncbi:MAG: thioesterase family protein [Nocardioidaceae bacterium]
MSEESFYVDDGRAADGTQHFTATEHTTSPWGDGVQHGGPPSALLARAVEAMPSAEVRAVARVTVDLWGPVPVGPVQVSTRVLRPGRTVELVSADLSAGARLVAQASAWRYVVTDNDTSATQTDVPPGPDHGRELSRPAAWCAGYFDAVEWRWVHGAVLTPGPATVWMRPRMPLVEGAEMSTLQRLLTCADSASGASAELDPADWAFMNTELSVHVLRPLVADWVCVDAATTLSGTSIGLATARLLDQDGLVGRSAQSLLVTRRAT